MSSYSNFVNCARGIPGFIVGQKEDVPYDITELANAYCKAKDENDQTKMNQYLSALFVRYWHVVVLIYNQSLSTKLEFDDIVSWIYEAFEKACNYRSWLDTSKAVSKDPKGAEKCINQCITSIRQYWYKHFNQDKRKINFIATSLDDIIPKKYLDDAPMTLLDTIEDPDENELFDTGHEIVQKYLDAGRIFEALVLDGILYQDSFKTSSKVEVVGQDEEGNNIEVTKSNSTFESIKLRKHLRQLNNNFIESFISLYNIDRDTLVSTVEDIKTFSKAKMTIRVNKAFNSFKNNKEIREWLCH